MDILQLYQESESIKEFSEARIGSKKDPNILAFSIKSGLPVKVVGEDLARSKIKGILPANEAALAEFIAKNKPFYLIPIDDVNQDVHGWLMRSVAGKEFYCVSMVESLIAGLWTLEGFKYGDTIVLVEGIKDLLAMTQFHPYVLSGLTASISSNITAYLKILTNRVVLALDSDVPGKRAAEKFKRTVGLQIINTVSPMKDPGDYYSNPVMMTSYMKMVADLSRSKS